MSARNTQQQDMIYEVLSKASKALSAEELLGLIEGKINKTTVYRVLDRFESNGKVHSILGASGKSYYAICRSCSSEEHRHSHIHFQCKTCKTVKCLSNKMIVPKIENHTVLDSQFLLIGLCNQCN